MKKCICETKTVIKDNKTGEALAVSIKENHGCPIHHPENCCEKHEWQISGPTNKFLARNFFVKLCKHCGKTDRIYD